jgi:polysaccharide deacetylase 2 family uncharacterized protein YibQ
VTGELLNIIPAANRIDEHTACLKLTNSEVVLRLPLGVDPTDQADSDAVMILTLAVCSDQIDISAFLNPSVARYNEVVADI